MPDKILTIEIKFTLRTACEGAQIQLIDGDGDIVAHADNAEDAMRFACEYLSISRYANGLEIDIDGAVQ